jgi:hypothetical protein
MGIDSGAHTKSSPSGVDFFYTTSFIIATDNKNGIRRANHPNAARARVPDAVQRLFGGAPQSRDLHDTASRTTDPGSAAHHHSASKARVNTLMVLRTVRETTDAAALDKCDKMG